MPPHISPFPKLPPPPLGPIRPNPARPTAPPAPPGPLGPLIDGLPRVLSWGVARLGRCSCVWLEQFAPGRWGSLFSPSLLSLSPLSSSPPFLSSFSAFLSFPLSPLAPLSLLSLSRPFGFSFPFHLWLPLGCGFLLTTGGNRLALAVLVV